MFRPTLFYKFSPTSKLSSSIIKSKTPLPSPIFPKKNQNSSYFFSSQIPRLSSSPSSKSHKLNFPTIPFQFTPKHHSFPIPPHTGTAALVTLSKAYFFTKKSPMSAPISNTIEYSKETTPTVVKSDQEWQKQLTTDEFYVLRQADTEPQYRGYTSFFESGIYECKGCNKPLYESGAKFKGCGYVYISIYFFRFLTFVHFLFFTFPSPSPSFTLPFISSPTVFSPLAGPLLMIVSPERSSPVLTQMEEGSKSFVHLVTLT